MSNYDQEYNHLRNEAEINKKYVFERPILILTICVAAINFGQPIQLPYIPSFITILLCFNLLFTVNRLRSASRIIAYIQYVIEKKYEPYIGWENYLMYHRKFRYELGKRELKELIKVESDRGLVSKGYGFYSMIYTFHIFVLLSSYGGILISDVKFSPLTMALSIISFICFLIIAIIYSNLKIKKNFPSEKVIISHILLYAQDPNYIDKIRNN